jgi:hypothetical protein
MESSERFSTRVGSYMHMDTLLGRQLPAITRKVISLVQCRILMQLIRIRFFRKYNNSFVTFSIFYRTILNNIRLFVAAPPASAIVQ